MKKKYLLLILVSFQFIALNNCLAQSGEWTWLNGSSTPLTSGNPGIKGVPSPTNEPPSLYEPCEWTDLNGNFWLFGGITQIANLHDNLWKYDPIANEWTWIAGTNVLNAPVNYGNKGVASATNGPGARGYACASWTDLNGNFWLFGGNNGSANLSDLWEFDVTLNEWIWMNGDSAVNAPGVYGIQGVPGPANYPPSREECSAAWTDSAGDLWIFGGLGYGSFSDLWRYNIATNSWTWMKGPDVTNQPGHYGVKGTEDTANVPSYRSVHCRWKDNSGNFWIYGGENGFNYNVYDDLWRFNHSTNSWTWMSGDSTLNDSAIFETKCGTSASAKPGAKEENRAAWTDANGNLLMFGGSTDGFGHSVTNDLWMYCLAKNQWTWMSGDSTLNPAGSWGTINVASATNKPSGRMGSVGWTDHKGHLYLFGGTGMITSFFLTYNDIWEYTIDPCCSACSSTLLSASFDAADSAFCDGNCATYTDHSINATSWQWSFPGGTPSSSTGQAPPSICYYTSGIYDAMLIVSNCNSNDTLTKSKYITVYPSPKTPVITQSHDTLMCSLDPSYVSYQWYYNTNPVSGATDTMLTNVTTGNYNVSVTDTDGCSIAVGINIVGIHEFIDNNGIYIYPNPVGKQLTIKNQGLEIGMVEIYNILGQACYQSEITKSESEIDVSMLSSGVYFVTLADEKSKWVGKFMKE